MTTHDPIETNLGELITSLYEEFLTLYGDEDLAAVAASTTLNELLASQLAQPVVQEAA